jgi:RNA polymerase sigma-70 factor (ECF subfamily)
MINADDTELFARVGEGNEKSLEEIYTRYAPVLLSSAQRVLNNSRDAEEVLQETLVQLWQKAGTYDQRRGKPLTWALTLTRNKAIDRLRRVQRRTRLHDDLEKEATLSSTAAVRDAARVVMANDTHQLVRNAVIQLSPSQRRAIELAFFSGMTQLEIAQQLREPLGTVKARIRRGLMRLRALIEPKL